jgi:hypothetical protein
MSQHQTLDAAAEYARERTEAEEDGTAFAEQTEDFPPADLYHAAQAIAVAIGEKTLTETWETIGVAGTDPTLWERLDVGRAASYLHHHEPDTFARVAQTYPWLNDYADQNAHDPLGALSDQF